MGDFFGSDDGGAMRKQQEDLDRMQEEEERKNKLVQARTIRGLKTAAGGSGGFANRDDKDTFG
jgi:hypothetical protein